MAPRIDREQVKTAVWLFVAAYAVLLAYAAVAGSRLAEVASELLFGLFVAGFGVLLFARATVQKLRVAGGLLVLGGGLAVVTPVAPVPDWLSTPPVVAGLGLYVYERRIREGTDRPDPLDPENA